MYDAWQVTPTLMVGAGCFNCTGHPGLIVVGPDAPPHLVGLPVRGAPGPASIEGVRGSYVLIAQGHRGRHLYDYLTGQVHPADEQWNPVE